VKRDLWEDARKFAIIMQIVGAAFLIFMFSYYAGRTTGYKKGLNDGITICHGEEVDR